MEFYNCSDDEVIANLLDPAFNDQPQTGVLQNVGYADTIFPSSTNCNPMVVTECTSYGIHHLREKFGLLNSESAHCRIIDIINQCRYIASKHGMNKKEIMASMKKDEMEGKTYLSCFPPAASSGGLSQTLAGFQGDVLLLSADADVKDFASYPSSSQPAFGAKCDHHHHTSFPFGPDEDEMLLEECSVHNTLLDPFFLDGESDFDQSETSELLKEMGKSKQGSKEEKSLSAGIPPTRKSATLNLAQEGEVRKESFGTHHHQPKVNKEAGKNGSTPARATKSNCTAKQLMVSTARIRACASFMQIMKRDQANPSEKVLPAGDLKASQGSQFTEVQTQKEGQ